MLDWIEKERWKQPTQRTVPYLWFMMNHGDATWSLEEIEEVAVSVCVASSIEAGARAVTACDDDDRIAIAIEEERKPCIYSIIVCIIMHPGRPPMDVAVVLAFASQLIQSRINNRSLVCMYVRYCHCQCHSWMVDI